jgi:hypothetical protein
LGLFWYLTDGVLNELTRKMVGMNRVRLEGVVDWESMVPRLTGAIGLAVWELEKHDTLSRFESLSCHVQWHLTSDETMLLLQH